MYGIRLFTEANSGLPVLVTRNISDFAAFEGLQLLNWFSSPCPP